MVCRGMQRYDLVRICRLGKASLEIVCDVLDWLDWQRIGMAGVFWYVMQSLGEVRRGRQAWKS